MSEEIGCGNCGSDLFIVTRISPDQILLECNDCGVHHILEAVGEDSPIIVFSLIKE
jgi:hypothetical protein